MNFDQSRFKPVSEIRLLTQLSIALNSEYLGISITKIKQRPELLEGLSFTKFTGQTDLSEDKSNLEKSLITNISQACQLIVEICDILTNELRLKTTQSLSGEIVLFQFTLSLAVVVNQMLKGLVYSGKTNLPYRFDYRLERNNFTHVILTPINLRFNSAVDSPAILNLHLIKLLVELEAIKTFLNRHFNPKPTALDES
jgi:hypothetical protein